jgi:hypothetical protein
MAASDVFPILWKWIFSSSFKDLMHCSQNVDCSIGYLHAFLNLLLLCFVLCCDIMNRLGSSMSKFKDELTLKIQFLKFF